jgi:hypothetical protein
MENTDKEISTEVAKRFVDVMNHLIRIGRAKNYTDFANKLNVPYQRVIDIKQFILADGKPAYPQISYIILLNHHFGVSTDYMISGTGDMITYEIAQVVNDIPELKMPETYEKQTNNIEYRVIELEGKVKALQDQVDYLKGKVI